MRLPPLLLLALLALLGVRTGALPAAAALGRSLQDDATATPAMARDLIAKIRTVSDLPIKYVLLSHYHAVRVLGATGFKSATDVIACCRSRANEWSTKPPARLSIRRRTARSTSRRGGDYRPPPRARA
jgi:glyoxylase-like metal-dependent hydrolase (beta-lactamase superfamily II)